MIPVRDTSRTKQSGPNSKDSLWRYSLLQEGRFLGGIPLRSDEAVQHCLRPSRAGSGVAVHPAELPHGTPYTACHGPHLTERYMAGRGAGTVLRLPGRHVGQQGRYIPGYTSPGQVGPLCAEQALPLRKGDTLRRGASPYSTAGKTLRRGASPYSTAGTSLRRGTPPCTHRG